MGDVDSSQPNEMPFLELRGTFDRALDHGAEHVDQLLDSLAARVGAVIAGRDRGQIVELRGQLTRLRQRATRRNDSRGLNAVRVLHSMGVALDSGAGAAIVSDHAARREATRRVLRGRILRALSPGLTLRPSELAEGLDAEPSEISRALGALLAEGRVAQVTGSVDARRQPHYTRVLSLPVADTVAASSA